MNREFYFSWRLYFVMSCLFFTCAIKAQAPVTLATLDQPTLFAVDATGNLFAQTASGDFFESTYGIAKITPSGAVISVINPLLTQDEPRSIAMDNNGNFYIREGSGINKIAPDGTVTPVDVGSISNPRKFVCDSQGNLFVLEIYSGSNYMVKKISPSGTVSTVIGPGIINTEDSFCADANGNIYVVNYNAPTAVYSILKISADGNYTVIADNGILNILLSMTCDAAGNLYVCTTPNYSDKSISKLSVQGNYTTLFSEGLPGDYNYPSAIAVDASGAVFLSYKNLGTILKFTETGCTPTTTTETVTACESYTWAENNQNYTQSGVYTNVVACATATLNLTITAQLQWYLDADSDGYYTGSAVSSCTSPGAGYTATVMGGGDCNDANSAIHPGVQATEPPIVNCWDNFVFNTGTCAWDNIGTPTSSTTNGSVTQSQTRGTYTWPAPGSGLTYDTSGTYTYIAGCNTATLNLTITPGNPGNEDDGGVLEGQDPPVITQLTSDGTNIITQGCGSSTLVVLGANFTGATAVTINGVAVASFVVTNDTTITAVLPVGPTSGMVTVTTPIGSGSSAGSFAIIAAPASVGTSAALVICAGSSVSASSLFAALGGTPAAGGTWSATTGGAGTYTYTQAATSPCTVDNTATVTVTEQAVPASAGSNGTLVICAGSSVSESSLFTALGGTPASGGTWSATTGGAGTYTYTQAATSPCTTAATATVTVTEQSQPNAGTNGTLTVCAGTTPTNAELFARLTGADAGGTWSTPAAGVYTYTVNAIVPCTGTNTAKVTVIEQVQPNAGTNGTLIVNAGTTPTNDQLFAQLGGIPTIGGSWTNVGLLYTYTVVAISPCTTAATATVTVTENTTTTWNGTAWSNGAPTVSLEAIIAGNYSTTTNGPVSAKKLTVNSGVLTVNSGNLTVVNELVNNSVATAVVFENNANLIQTGTATNTGDITVKRNSSTLRLLDYTLWSSPVASQNLLAFSLATVLSRFYNYNTATNLYNAVPSPATTPFAVGNGYLIRMPNTASPSVDTAYPGVFTGVPNNGVIPVALANNGVGFRFNLVGNPYPSPISMTQLVSDNSANINGTLYFWRKRNGVNGGSYCTWNGGTFVTNNNAQVVNPNGIIQTGQGFFVEAKNTATSMTFNNGQRAANNAGQFFKTKQVIENNRIWLNATNETGEFAQMAINYATGAEQGLDDFDSKYFNDGAIALNSVLDNADYVIQGRALPFDGTDEVPLSFRVTTAGTYSIAIDHVDGLFTGSQDVILKDNVTGTETNLKAGAYAFAADAGASSSRFVLKFQKTLGTTTPEFSENSVIISTKKGIIYINSGSSTMSKVQLFDMNGRLVFKKENVNNSETTVDASRFAHQVLIVKITSDDNREVSKKVVH